MSDIKNAIIENTKLGFEGHGILSFSIQLDYGDAGQIAGGWALDAPLKDADGVFIKRVGSAIGTHLILEILNVVGVENWEDLKGQHVRVDSSMTKVYAIGNLLKNRWIKFDEFFKAEIK